MPEYYTDPLTSNADGFLDSRMSPENKPAMMKIGWGVIAIIACIGFVLAIITFINDQDERRNSHLALGTAGGVLTRGDVIVPRIVDQNPRWTQAMPESPTHVPLASGTIALSATLHDGAVIADLVETLGGAMALRLTPYNAQTFSFGASAQYELSAISGGVWGAGAFDSLAMTSLADGIGLAIVSKDDGADTASVGIVDVTSDVNATPVLRAPVVALEGANDVWYYSICVTESGNLMVSYNKSASINVSAFNVTGFVFNETSLAIGTSAVSAGTFASVSSLPRLGAGRSNVAVLASNDGYEAFTVSAAGVIAAAGAYTTLATGNSLEPRQPQLLDSTSGCMILSSNNTSGVIYYLLVDVNGASGAIGRTAAEQPVQMWGMPAWAMSPQAPGNTDWYVHSDASKRSARMVVPSSDVNQRATALLGTLASADDVTMSWSFMDVMSNLSITADGLLNVTPIGDGWRYALSYRPFFDADGAITELLDFSAAAGLVTVASGDSGTQEVSGTTRIGGFSKLEFEGPTAAGAGGKISYVLDSTSIMIYSA